MQPFEIGEEPLLLDHPPPTPHPPPSPIFFHDASDVDVPSLCKGAAAVVIHSAVLRTFPNLLL